MLQNAHLYLIQRAATALRGHGDTEIANALDAVITADLAARTSTSEAQKARHKANQENGTSKSGRPPSAIIVVELSPGWRATATGTKAAHAMLETALHELGRPAVLPTLGSLRAALGRSGIWWTNVETENGTVTVSAAQS